MWPIACCSFCQAARHRRLLRGRPDDIGTVAAEHNRRGRNCGQRRYALAAVGGTHAAGIQLPLVHSAVAARSAGGAPGYWPAGVRHIPLCCAALRGWIEHSGAGPGIPHQCRHQRRRVAPGGPGLCRQHETGRGGGADAGAGGRWPLPRAVAARVAVRIGRIGVGLHPSDGLRIDRRQRREQRPWAAGAAETGQAPPPGLHGCRSRQEPLAGQWAAWQFDWAGHRRRACA